MSTMGCHNCPVNLDDFKEVPYQQTPCAHCKLAKQPSYSCKRMPLFDSDAAVDDVIDQVDTHSCQQSIDIKEVPWSVVQEIKRACQQNLLATLSNVILKIVKMAHESPRTAEILLIKMQHPELSYYDIALSLDPPCSKQNVLHHLKHAVDMFPQLSAALLIDTRFAPGKGSAVHSVAKIQENNKAVAKLRDSIYEKTKHNAVKDISQISAIFKLPYTHSVSFVSPYKETHK